MFTVYCITNRVNGKKYIGMTKRTVDQRWRSHLSSARQGSKFRFHSAIRKYGVDNWFIEVILETDDEISARTAEEEHIALAQTIDQRVGYNAKPGGCGGWIVPEDRVDEWRKSIRLAMVGRNNPNALNVSNEELIEIGCRFAKDFGYVPGRNTMRRYAERNGLLFPKSFTKFRFNGSYPEYAKEVSKMSGCEYRPHTRSQEHLESLRLNTKGKSWYHNDETRKNKQMFNNEVPAGWLKGRKKYD